MDLPSLAYAFGCFVRRESRRFRPARRNFVARRGFAAGRGRRLRYFNRNNRRQAPPGFRRAGPGRGLRRWPHRHDHRGAARRHFGPGGGRPHHHNYRQHDHRGHGWVQRRHFRDAPRTSTRAVMHREEAPSMPEVAAADLEVAAVVPEVAAEVPEVAVVQEVAENQNVEAVFEDEASASNVTAGTDELMPPPPAFSIPPMEWLLAGPSAEWLVDDPERHFSEDDELAPPIPPSYYYGPCLPSPTPSDEDLEHFAPPGYAPVPEFSSSSTMAPKPEKMDDAAPAPARTVVPNLNLPAPDMMEENTEDVPPTTALPTPSPEARVLLRRFAAAMAARPSGIRAGTWSPAALGLSSSTTTLRLDGADPQLPSSSAEGPSRR